MNIFVVNMVRTRSILPVSLIILLLSLGVVLFKLNLIGSGRSAKQQAGEADKRKSESTGEGYLGHDRVSFSKADRLSGRCGGAAGSLSPTAAFLPQKASGTI